MKTLTEKYRLVLENKFSKKQFVTDARRLHPSLITQLNSFNDTVSILKNKGLIFESEMQKYKAEKAPTYEKERTADDYSLDHLERAIDTELEEKGFDTTSINFSEEDYLAAKKKALTNLEKDYNYYLNKMAGVKSNSKRTDEMKPVEKEFNDKDNEMKKVKLQESFKKLIKKVISEDLDFEDFTEPDEPTHSRVPNISAEALYRLADALMDSRERELVQAGRLIEDAADLVNNYEMSMKNKDRYPFLEEDMEDDTISRDSSMEDRVERAMADYYSAID